MGSSSGGAHCEPLLALNKGRTVEGWRGKKKVLVLQPCSVSATEGIKPSAGVLNLIKRLLSVYAQR